MVYNIHMSEAEFQTFITKWMLYRYHVDMGYNISLYDCKVVDKESLAPSKVKEHQVRALTNGRGDVGLSYKIPDVGVMQKPCDGFMVRNVPSWLVILFNRSEKDKRFFCLYDMKNWDGTSVTPNKCTACFTFYSDKKIPEKKEAL